MDTAFTQLDNGIVSANTLVSPATTKSFPSHQQARMTISFQTLIHRVFVTVVLASLVPMAQAQIKAPGIVDTPSVGTRMPDGSIQWSLVGQQLGVRIAGSYAANRRPEWRIGTSKGARIVARTTFASYAPNDNTVLTMGLMEVNRRVALIFDNPASSDSQCIAFLRPGASVIGTVPVRLNMTDFVELAPYAGAACSVGGGEVGRWTGSGTIVANELGDLKLSVQLEAFGRSGAKKLLIEVFNGWSGNLYPPDNASSIAVSAAVGLPPALPLDFAGSNKHPDCDLLATGTDVTTIYCTSKESLNAYVYSNLIASNDYKLDQPCIACANRGYTIFVKNKPNVFAPFDTTEVKSYLALAQRLHRGDGQPKDLQAAYKAINDAYRVGYYKENDDRFWQSEHTELRRQMQAEYDAIFNELKKPQKYEPLLDVLIKNKCVLWDSGVITSYDTNLSTGETRVGKPYTADTFKNICAAPLEIFFTCEFEKTLRDGRRIMLAQGVHLEPKETVGTEVINQKAVSHPFTTWGAEGMLHPARWGGADESDGWVGGIRTLRCRTIPAGSQNGVIP